MLWYMFSLVRRRGAGWKHQHLLSCDSMSGKVLCHLQKNLDLQIWSHFIKKQIRRPKVTGQGYAVKSLHLRLWLNGRSWFCRIGWECELCGDLAWTQILALSRTSFATWASDLTWCLSLLSCEVERKIVIVMRTKWTDSREILRMMPGVLGVRSRCKLLLLGGWGHGGVRITPKFLTQTSQDDTFAFSHVQWTPEGSGVLLCLP